MSKNVSKKKNKNKNKNKKKPVDVEDQQDKAKWTKTPFVVEREREDEGLDVTDKEEHVHEPEVEAENELAIDKPSALATHGKLSDLDLEMWDDAKLMDAIGEVEDFLLMEEDDEEEEEEEEEEEDYRSIERTMGTRMFKLACALTTLTFEGFEKIWWGSSYYAFQMWEDVHYFKYELFDAMARFIWNLYDEEDIENFAFTDDISSECERIWRKVVSTEGKFELDSPLLNIIEHSILREQDVCNIFKWYNEYISPNNNELTETNLDCNVLFHEHYPLYRMRDFKRCVWRAERIVMAYDNLDPKGKEKQQLRMELIDRKCFCVVDALYMESWRHMNFRKLEEDGNGRFGALVDLIHKVFHGLVGIRMEYLHFCENLVTYPLSGNMFGSWDSEVKQVIKYADLKRRSEGRRFIGKDHLVFCLHQMLVSDDERAKKISKVLRFSDDDVDKRKDETVYQLYRKTYKITTKLGDETIGVEHLYVAITSTNDDESSWKESVECVRMAKTKRNGKCKEGEDPHTNELWIGIIKDHTKRKIVGMTVLDAVKKIRDKSNTRLQDAIDDVLYQLDECPTQQISQREMINSLKKYIEAQKIPS